MDKYKTIYKCRLCGERYATGKPVKCETAIAATSCLVLNIKGVVPETPTLTDTHICGGDHTGSIGLADFQGWEACPDE